MVWLLPAPVRTAHTLITGLVDLSAVYLGPIRMKSAPRALTCADLCITYSYFTSEYANTTWSTSCAFTSSSSSSSGWIGIPSGYSLPARVAGYLRSSMYGIWVAVKATTSYCSLSRKKVLKL